MFVPGLEDGLLPHTRAVQNVRRPRVWALSADGRGRGPHPPAVGAAAVLQAEQNPQGLEEERRLLYVAMTRAKYYLHLSRSARRVQMGQDMRNPRSRFMTPGITAQFTAAETPADDDFECSLPILARLLGRPVPPPDVAQAMADRIAPIQVAPPLALWDVWHGLAGSRIHRS